MKQTIIAINRLKRLIQYVDACILVDAPEINMRLLKWIRKHPSPNIRHKVIIYLAPPQVWAWRQHRIKLLSKATMIGCLFKFEVRWFHSKGLMAQYIGHPLVKTSQSPSLLQDNKLNESASHSHPTCKFLAFFPGSRKSSVKRTMPLGLKAFSELCTLLNLDIHIQLAHTKWVQARVYLQAQKAFEKYLRKKHWTKVDSPTHMPSRLTHTQLRSDSLESLVTWQSPQGYNLSLEYISTPHQPLETSLNHQRHPALEQVTIALCHAGTATLECALSGVIPITIAPLSWLSSFIAKKLIKIEQVSLPNLCLQQKIFPELVLEDCQASKIAEIMCNTLHSEDSFQAALLELLQIMKPLTRESLEPSFKRSLSIDNNL